MDAARFVVKDGNLVDMKRGRVAPFANEDGSLQRIADECNANPARFDTFASVPLPKVKTARAT